MMLWIDLLLIVVFAAILSAVLAWGFGWRHPRSAADAIGASVLFLFLILMFVMWAGAVWFPPWGPVLFGAPWLSILLIGLFTALLILAAAAPARRPRTAREAVEQAEEEAVVGSAFGLFFWVLIIGLLAVALISYFVR